MVATGAPKRAQWILSVALSLAAAPWGPARAEPPPNIIVLISDDWGWPHYGVMQRYLRAKVTNGELIASDPAVSGEEYGDFEIILPDDTSEATPPIDTLLTPAIDTLAAAGSFFPVAHGAASICKPGLAAIMTGLSFHDMDKLPAPRNKALPTLPEWLPGFGQEFGAANPSHYITMAAGKWQYEVSHTDLLGNPKNPWDRDMPKGTGTGGKRDQKLLLPYDAYIGTAPFQPALEPLKDFIDCARCTRSCYQGAHAGKPCTDHADCPGGVCREPCQALPTQDAERDSARLRARRLSCTPQPFFIVLEPFMPHASGRPDEFCPYFTRDAAQCAAPPYSTFSVYCNPARPCAELDSQLIAIANNVAIEPAKRTLDRQRSYLRWANIFDRAVDELVVHLKDRGLYDSTAILYTTDNSAQISGSKGAFSEHGYRTLLLFHYPPMDGPPNPPPTVRNGCAGQPGCRTEFAQFTDVLATIKDLAGSGTDCPTPGGCPPLARYDDGKTLRTAVDHSCFPPGSIPDPNYRQCLIGTRKGSQTLYPQDSWYVLAEVTDAHDVVHLCKLFRSCDSVGARLYDLNNDPYENRDLMRSGNPPFCGTSAVRCKLETILRTHVAHKTWDGGCLSALFGCW
jgi:arylsulfatase A-like enzyme